MLYVDIKKPGAILLPASDGLTDISNQDSFGFRTYTVPVYLHSYLRLVRRQLVSAVKIIMNHSRPVKIILDRPKTSQPVKEFLTGRKFSTHENKSRNILKGWICTSLDGMTSWPVILKT